MTADRPIALDPLVAPPDQGADDVGHLLYRSLLRLDSTAYPVGDLATGDTVTADGLTYALPLRPGLHWSNGRAITAADAVATIKLAESARDTDAQVVAGLSGVVARAFGSEVLLQLPAPRASLPAVLTRLPILPLGGESEQQISRLAAAPTTILATSGPYAVTSSTASDLELGVNAHSTATPNLQTLDIRLFPTFAAAASAFSDGDVDAMLAATPAERAQLLGVSGAHAATIATFRFVDLIFNERTPGLDDSVVRQAIAAVVNRSALVAGALDGTGGRVQSGAMDAGIPWIGTITPPALSATAAAAGLRSDGWRSAAGVLSRNGVSLTFSLSVEDVSPLPAVARELAAQLAPLGIAVHIAQVPAGTLVSARLVPGRFQMALADWDNGPDPDVSAFWRSNAVPPHGFNVSGGPVDPFLDQALDGLATISDRSARIAAARQVVALLAQDAPAVFLYAPEVSIVFRIPMRNDAVPPVGGSAARYDDIASWRTG